MQKVTVKCPQCGQAFMVTNKNDLPLVKVKCPSCQSSLTLRFSAKASHSEDLKNDDPNETEPAGDLKKYKIGTLVYNGIPYQLQMGKNIVGRAASTSSASVRIKTSDLFMSRQHAVIEVARLNNAMIKTVISNFKNKNATFVNGQRIMENDRFMLEDGAIITMGKTEMKYVVPVGTDLATSK